MGVLAITVFPLLFGMLIRGIVGAASGVFVGSTAIAAIAVPILLIALFSYSLVPATE